MTRKDTNVEIVNPFSFMGLLASHGKVPGAVSAPVSTPVDAPINRRRFRRK